MVTDPHATHITLHAATHSQALLCWTTLFAPLAAAISILLVAVQRKRLASALAVLGIVGAFFSAAVLFYQALNGSLILPIEVSFNWIALPVLTIPFGVLIDTGSLLMTLVVTGVGSLIFIYSTSYMHDDDAYSRYFGMLSLFAFSMLTIVLATNWIQLFIGWELVGFSSYMLIGHWYAKPEAAAAGKKAFMVNRVADFGFLLGILSLWALSSPELAHRTVSFAVLTERLPLLVHSHQVSAGTLTLVALLLFCGPVGKSAQFPLHVWLPDAMEGPTPVSALIHAATMVAAGVYLLFRAFWLFELVPNVLVVVAWVGGLTAFLAAALALVENDLKRILAYSTLSQLGYMVLAIGMHAPFAAMFHLTTHAFFKALLFLGAGSVMHATHELNIWKLGGLWRSMRLTSVTFLIGSLALMGIPGLSGFFSKEAILVAAHEHHLGLYWLAVITAGMTAFYTARAWFVAFTGPEHTHAHESEATMTVPLVVLSLFAIIGGYLGITHFLGDHAEHSMHWNIAAASLIVVMSGITLAWLLYARSRASSAVAKRFGPLVTFLQNRYYIDHIYDGYVAFIQQRFIVEFFYWFEQTFVIGIMVNGAAYLTRGIGSLLRLCQTGRVQTYVLFVTTGLAALFYFTLLK